jgi:hypothetical protein
VPPLFVHQLTQILLRISSARTPVDRGARGRNAVSRPENKRAGGRGDGGRRTGGRVAGDDRKLGSLGELLAQNRTPARTVDLDVLSEDNADTYWTRDERRPGDQPSIAASPRSRRLCRVLPLDSAFPGGRRRIAPEREIVDARWVWHVGLDAEASAAAQRSVQRRGRRRRSRERLLCLFALRFSDPAAMRPAIAGRSVYLAMAMDRENRLR